jgi:hypothetical protein
VQHAGEQAVVSELLESALIGFERRSAAEKQLRRAAGTSGIAKERLPQRSGDEEDGGTDHQRANLHQISWRPFATG